VPALQATPPPAAEVGHELQFAYDTFTGGGIRDEQGADCLAGFFVGWLACAMRLTERDVMAEFDTMCDIGDDDTGIPWWSPARAGRSRQKLHASSGWILAAYACAPRSNALVRCSQVPGPAGESRAPWPGS